MKALIVGLILAVAGAANAAVTYTCTPDADFSVTNGRVVFGSCTATGTYAAGGDPLGTSADAANTATTIGCAIGQLKNLVVTSAVDRGADNALALSFDHTAFKMQMFTASGTPTATTRLVEFGAGATATLEFRYVAFCK